jgi:uncharacterized protein (DUF433 family)
MDGVPNERIVKTPGVCGDRARLAGHRVRVLDIVNWDEHQGLTPDEIVSQVPSITLAEVHAALAWYFDHVEEIQTEIREERALVDERAGITFRRSMRSVRIIAKHPDGCRFGFTWTNTFPAVSRLVFATAALT